MFQWAHVGTAVCFVFEILLRVFNCGERLVHLTGVEDLVQAVSAWMYLKRVRNQDEDHDGKLANGDEQGGGWIHRDDVGADLYNRSITEKANTLRAGIRTFEPKVR